MRGRGGAGKVSPARRGWLSGSRLTFWKVGTRSRSATASTTPLTAPSPMFCWLRSICGFRKVRDPTADCLPLHMLSVPHALRAWPLRRPLPGTRHCLHSTRLRHACMLCLLCMRTLPPASARPPACNQRHGQPRSRLAHWHRRGGPPSSTAIRGFTCMHVAPQAVLSQALQVLHVHAWQSGMAVQRGSTQRWVQRKSTSMHGDQAWQ
jgi:hypothetical protein